ncbi:MAG: indolepyruvate oxidoreductase subunit beta [Dissulfurispiraceae bacterium]|jgi:indolepyruvate ferredoxin oxidoreductase beta subunit|nr:indolepyruvate oxidoreductase subunit beta [Dissulfurispiraceae bacterium]
MATTSVFFAGVGGQGIVLGSKILAQAAFSAGCMVKECELHGMAQRGGSVVSHIRFGEEVHSPLIPQGKADFLIVMEALEGLRYTCYLKPGATVILNSRQIIPSTVTQGSAIYPENISDKFRQMGYRVVEIDAAEIARQSGNPKGENIVLIGALSSQLKFNEQIWIETITDSVPPKTIEQNIDSFNKGRQFSAAALS